MSDKWHNKIYAGNVFVAYINYIQVYSPNLEEHLNHVKKVLSGLLENHLYVKVEKCEFHVTQVTFLGYISSPEGFTMDNVSRELLADKLALE